jgi:hypothetical protein
MRGLGGQRGVPGLTVAASWRVVPIAVVPLAVVPLADKCQDCGMPRESWQLSRGLRAATAAHGLIYLGLVYVVMRFFFPRVLFLPVTVIAAVLYVAACFARFQVVLDRVGDEVAITVGWWTRHVPLTQIERIRVVRSGVDIRIAGGTGYGIGPLWKRRWLRGLPPVRSGFEGMDVAIMAAAAAARAADPDRAAAEDAASRRAASWRTVFAASFASVVGLVSLAAAVVVQPRANGWLVHVVAVLLRIYFGVAGAVVVLVGAGLLVSTWRNRGTVRRHTETVLL